MSLGGIEGSFKETFKLQSDEDIKDYFPENKKSWQEALVTTFRRASHFISTGASINEKRVCEWVNDHPGQTIDELFSGKAIQRKVIRHQAKMVVEKPTMKDWLLESGKFLVEFIQHPTTVGAMLPSSKWLAKEIVSQIPKDLKSPQRFILEVGPGTGVFTDKIIKRMNPEDILHLVEFDKVFAEALKKKYGHIKNVKVISGDILKYTNQEKYDYIVSGLPLNSFTVADVKNVFQKFIDLIKPKGKISYFEYMAVPDVRLAVSTADDCKKLREILSIKKAFHEKHYKSEGHVYLNITPARVLHHEIANNS